MLEPFLAQYPQLKYSYLIEIKYLKPQGKKKTLPPLSPGKVKTLKAEAETQLGRYGPDEKFQKAIGQTLLKKLVLIFCGSRLVYHGEVVGDHAL